MDTFFQAERSLEGGTMVLAQQCGGFDGLAHGNPEPFTQKMEEYLRSHILYVILDWSELKSFCELAFGTFALYQSEFYYRGGDIKLFRVPSKIQSVIDMLNLRECVKVCETLDKALAVIYEEKLRQNELQEAWQIEAVEKITRLLESDVNPNVRDLQGRTPLIWSCEKGFWEIAELLLKKGANPNAEDKAGNIPLVLACQKGATDIVRTLLKQGAKPNVRDHAGKTPLQLAEERGFSQISALLLEKGAISQEKSPDVKDIASQARPDQPANGTSSVPTSQIVSFKKSRLWDKHERGRNS